VRLLRHRWIRRGTMGGGDLWPKQDCFIGYWTVVANVHPHYPRLPVLSYLVITLPIPWWTETLLYSWRGERIGWHFPRWIFRVIDGEFTWTNGRSVDFVWYPWRMHEAHETPAWEPARPIWPDGNR
jgi:hypothetical protein